MQGRRKSVFARSVHALRIGNVGQICTELELYCCCGTAMLAKLFWGFLVVYLGENNPQPTSKWRN